VQVTDSERVRRAAVSVAALAQNGLAFASDGYEIARYRQLLATSAELFSVLADRPADDLRLELERDSGYATPKVDVRGALFDDAGRVLLMRERSDGMYALPGGWADPHDTPSEAVIREMREETGYGVEVVKLIACYDRDMQGHLPALPVAVYKLFFLCRATGQIQQPETLETLDIGWFALETLPPLSKGRVLAVQLRTALRHRLHPSLPTEFD